MKAEHLLRDIYALDQDLRWYEQKYGLLSATFYRLYEAGQLSDEEPKEVCDYVDWAGCYQARLDRAQEYDALIQHRLEQLERPASLRDLALTHLDAPA